MPPPIGENPYPRGQMPNYGSATKLRMLRDAYYGIYWLIAGTVGTWVVPQVGIELLAMMGEASEDLVLVLFAMSGVLMLVVNFFIAFKFAKLVAQAKERSVGYAVGLAVGSALLSPCCLGLVGCMVIQQAVTNEVKIYGMKGGFLGIRKHDFDAQIEALERAGRG